MKQAPSDFRVREFFSTCNRCNSESFWKTTQTRCDSKQNIFATISTVRHDHTTGHNLAVAGYFFGCKTSRRVSMVRMTHSVPSSPESHLSSSFRPCTVRALRRPKTWLVSWGPTPPSARRQATPTTEPRVRLRLPCSFSPGRGARTEPYDWIINAKIERPLSIGLGAQTHDRRQNKVSATVKKGTMRRTHR